MPSLDCDFPLSLFLPTIVRHLWGLIEASVLLKCIKLLEQKSMRIFPPIFNSFLLEEDRQRLKRLVAGISVTFYPLLKESEGRIVLSTPMLQDGYKLE